MIKRKDKRIKQRYQCLMPVSLVLKEQVEGNMLAGPGKGSFCNISSGGAALVVDKVDFGDYHLAESSIDDPDAVLELEVNGMVILSRAVWCHPVSAGGDKKFRLGVEFLKPPSDYELTEMVSSTKEEKSVGWKKIVGKLFS